MTSTSSDLTSNTLFKLCSFIIQVTLDEQYMAVRMQTKEQKLNEIYEINENTLKHKDSIETSFN